MPATPNILVRIETDDEALDRVRRIAADEIVDCIPRIWPGDELPTPLIPDQAILFAGDLERYFAGQPLLNELSVRNIAQD